MTDVVERSVKALLLNLGQGLMKVSHRMNGCIAPSSSSVSLLLKHWLLYRLPYVSMVVGQMECLLCPQ